MNYIINADDFGLTESSTKAICEAFERKFITDTTMMANGEAYDLALSCIETYQLQDKVGIHFNLTEGEPLTEAIKYCNSFVFDKKFHGKINRLKPLTRMEKQAVLEELEAQALKLRLDGINLTRADSHHHIHTGIFIAPLVIKVCKKYGISTIRIHRNIGRIPTYKKVIKKMYNIWLRKQNFHTTKCFGSIEDIEYEIRRGKKCEQLEIMVHPDFDREGHLIDRIDEVNGFPVGKKLYHPEV